MALRPELDLDVAPPPGIAIEVGYKSDSAKALKLYARIGTPELWRYKPRSKSLWFGRLVGDDYETIERGLNLPLQTPALVRFALEKIDEMGETHSKSWLRKWARGLPNPPA